LIWKKPWNAYSDNYQTKGMARCQAYGFGGLRDYATFKETRMHKNTLVDKVYYD